MHQPNLSEKDLLNDLLETEKSLLSSYSTYLAEASCPNLRNVLHGNFSQTAQDQFEVWSHMKQKGYYATKDAQDNEVQQAKQKFAQMKSTELS